MKGHYGVQARVLSVLLVATVLSGLMLVSRGAAGKPAIVEVRGISQAAPQATLGAHISETGTAPVVTGHDAATTTRAAPPSNTVANSVGATQRTNEQSTPSSIPTPPSNQPGEPTVILHVGGYPPAVSAALTDFMDPAHVPCSGSQLQNPDCSFNLYQWEETKYCIFTYADHHTQQQVYQYLAYGDLYANADGSLNPSGINMAVTSGPTYACNVDSAPTSVFEPDYTY